MNLNTNTKKLTLTKTERGYLDKAKAILLDLARLAPPGDMADAADVGAEQIGEVQKELAETQGELIPDDKKGAAK